VMVSRRFPEGLQARHDNVIGDSSRRSLPAATGRKMHFTGTTVLRIQDGKMEGVRIVGALPYAQFDAKIQEFLKQAPTAKN